MGGKVIALIGCSAFAVMFVCIASMAVFFLVLNPRKTADNNPNREISPVIDEKPSEIVNVPKSVNDFLDQGDLDRLTELNFPVYTGVTPPEVDGIFYINSWTVKSDVAYPDYVGGKIDNSYYTFSNQSSAGNIEVSYYTETAQDKASGQGGYIAGSGNCFTVFIDFNGDTAGCSYTQPAVISGCVTDAGITGWSYANIMKERDERTECDQYLMVKDNFRTITEDDGLAERK